MNGRLARLCVTRLIVLPLAIALCAAPAPGDEVKPSQLDVPYEPTHSEVVDLMLRLAEVTQDDYVVDLGCGDGRIVVAAARRFGARGLGIDLDGQRIRESVDNASYAGVSDLVQFRMANIMNVPIHEADVVTMYLLDEVNLMIRPKLFRELRAGTRVVSHAFHMDDWEADRTTRHSRARNGIVYLWIIPASVGGTWEWMTSTPQGNVRTVLNVSQEFQVLTALADFPELSVTSPVQAAISGKKLTLTTDADLQGQKVRLRYEGIVEGDEIHGTQEQLDGPSPGEHAWTARRESAELPGTWELLVPTSPVLNGIVHIGRSGNTLLAQYTCNDNTPGDAFYIWGRSIRIDTTRGNNKVIFRGALDSQAGSGTLYRQGWTQEPQWFARKVSDDVPASLTAAPPEESATAAPSAPTAQARGETGTVQRRDEPNAPVQPAAPAIPYPRRRWMPGMGAPQRGDEYINPADGSVLIWIPGGEFSMGDDRGQADEKPAHKTTVRGFWLGKFEVTNEQYHKFLRASGATRPYHADDPNYNDPNQPVVGVTWLEAVRYCQWAGLRLPTEAEWEYAACAGTQAEYPTQTGVISRALANARGAAGPDQWEYTSPVGRFPPNALGLYDMAGNAWEWTSSAFSPYPYVATDGREGQQIGALRVLRGGAWSFPPQYCRTKHRHRFASHLRCEYPGIRVALTAPPATSRARNARTVANRTR